MPVAMAPAEGARPRHYAFSLRARYFHQLDTARGHDDYISRLISFHDILRMPQVRRGNAACRRDVVSRDTDAGSAGSPPINDSCRDMISHSSYIRRKRGRLEEHHVSPYFSQRSSTLAPYRMPPARATSASAANFSRETRSPRALRSRIKHGATVAVDAAPLECHLRTLARAAMGASMRSLRLAYITHAVSHADGSAISKANIIFGSHTTPRGREVRSRHRSAPSSR